MAQKCLVEAAHFWLVCILCEARDCIQHDWRRAGNAEYFQVTNEDSGELAVRVLHPHSNSHRWVHLRGGWADTLVKPGDAANVLTHPSSWSPGPQGELHLVIDNGIGGLFVLHPDLLISGTSIAAALRCPRQAILQEKGVGASSEAACLGTLAHEVVQSALQALAGVDGGGGGDNEACNRRVTLHPLPVPRGACVIWLHA
jgi:hypothetical protein